MQPAVRQSAFSVNSLVRRVCLDSSSVDIYELAEQVYQAIPEKHRDEALRQALAWVVRSSVSQGRPEMFIGRHTASETHTPRVSTPSHTVPQSFRVQEIRDHWRRALGARIGVSDGLKMLGDCTADDLSYAALLRDEQAVLNAQKAEQYRKLADMVRDYGVAKVRDLPDDALASVFGE